MCIIYIVAVFVFLRSGTKDMKSSQQYPRQFGHQVASHHISYMLSETCLRAVVIPNMQTNIYIYVIFCLAIHVCRIEDSPCPDLVTFIREHGYQEKLYKYMKPMSSFLAAWP